MFESLSDRLQGVFQKLGSKGVLTEEDVREGMKQVRLALLEADVNYKVVKDFVARVTEKAVGEEVMKSLTPDQQVVKIVHKELIDLLGEFNVPLKEVHPGPTIVMLVGLQGTGKTTLAAKLGIYLRKQLNKRPLLVACDVYRPAAIKQLELLGKQLNIPVYSEGTEASPPDIARRAVEHARQEMHNIVILDTAGRLQIDESLMEELEQIDEAVSVAERILVVDAMTGQEAVRVADTFNQRIELSGLALTKMDGDARGGAALSVRSVTGVPIKFLSTGEKVDRNTFEPFHPDRLASRILGMGDVLSLIERAEEVYTEDQAKSMHKKFRKGEFDFEDFLEAMRQMRKLGPFQQILSMIPGLNQVARSLEEQDQMVGEREIKRIEAMICSMTPKERRNPQIIKGSRRERIAKGSGTEVQDVSGLVKQFQQMQRMIKQMTSGGKGKKGKKGRGGDAQIDPRDIMKMLQQ